MTTRPHRYREAVVAFGTMHGKEQLARRAFDDVLATTVIAPPGIDTDRFGTFAGDVSRTRTPRETAVAKARLATRVAGVPFALSSEGSFTTPFGWITRQSEHVLFLDEERGVHLLESHVGSIPLPPGRDVSTLDQALRFADVLGFPRQGLIVQAYHGGEMDVAKDLRSRAELVALVERLLAREAQISVLPDFRAHRCPARADVIRELCARMATRLNTACPGCAAPGWGRIDVTFGLPCGACGAPTGLPRADVFGCASCDATAVIPRGRGHAEPRWCDVCNA